MFCCCQSPWRTSQETEMYFNWLKRSWVYIVDFQSILLVSVFRGWLVVVLIHVQYSTVQYSIVQHSIVQQIMLVGCCLNTCLVQYSTVQYSIVQQIMLVGCGLNTCLVQYSTVQYSIVWYGIVQYCILQYSTVQYSIVYYTVVQYSIVDNVGWLLS